jgi:hypothetical protein
MQDIQKMPTDIPTGYADAGGWQRTLRLLAVWTAI